MKKTCYHTCFHDENSRDLNMVILKFNLIWIQWAGGLPGDGAEVIDVFKYRKVYFFSNKHHFFIFIIYYLSFIMKCTTFSTQDLVIFLEYLTITSINPER